MTKYRIRSTLRGTRDPRVVWLVEKKRWFGWNEIDYHFSKAEALRDLNNRNNLEMTVKHFKSEVEYPQ